MIDLHNMTVLICDDMENMCKSIRAMLKILKYGPRFKFAHNGRDAWNLLKSAHIDLAIIDWNMPIMTGIELLELIRESKEHRDMPVVMITAENNSEIVAEAAESDIDSYILKPLTVKSLGDRIAAVIQRTNNPPPMFRHLKKSREMEEAGDIGSAIKEAMFANKADPLSSKPLRTLGYLFFKKKELDEAEKYLYMAAKMNRLDVFALHYLGEIYLQRDDIDKAALFFEKAMTISPRHVSRGVNFGKLLVQNNRLEKAVSVFEKAISLSSSPLSLREEIAELCLKHKAYGYAETLMEFIVENVPTRYDLVVKLGVLNSKLGQHGKALRYLIEAEKNDNENVKIKTYIAKNYMAIGQMLRADDVLNNIIRIDPENEEARELLRQNV